MRDLFIPENANVFAKHNRYVNNTGLIGFPKLVNYSSRFNPLGGILKWLTSFSFRADVGIRSQTLIIDGFRLSFEAPLSDLSFEIQLDRFIHWIDWFVRQIISAQILVYFFLIFFENSSNKLSALKTLYKFGLSIYFIALFKISRLSNLPRPLR